MGWFRPPLVSRILSTAYTDWASIGSAAVGCLRGCWGSRPEPL